MTTAGRFKFRRVPFVLTKMHAALVAGAEAGAAAVVARARQALLRMKWRRLAVVMRVSPVLMKMSMR